MKSDIRALLLTDVVDSTKLAARIGDQQMAAIWAAHDRVARDLLPQHGGREIDKTDGMLLMFDAAAAAVAYALAYHRALATLPTPLAARAGLHVGPVILRENSAEDVARGAKPIEVDGLAKPTAARVMSMARGGQVLLTPEAVADLGEQVAAWRTTSHGHWALKGLTDPIEVFEVGDEQTKFAPPEEAEKAHRMVRSGERWVPVSALPNNLPPQRSTFVGRETELNEIKALLDESALVTAWEVWARRGSRCKPPPSCCRATPTAPGSLISAASATRRSWSARWRVCSRSSTSRAARSSTRCAAGSSPSAS
jgi:class 3 adenylate cyclase